MMRLSPRARSVVASAGLFALAACAGSGGGGGASPVVRNPVEERVQALLDLGADSTDADAWFRLGLAWQTDTTSIGHLDSARVAFDQLLVRAPDHVRGLVHSGLVLEELEEYDEAVERYRRAIEVAPDDPLPRIDLGSLLYFHYRKTNEAKEQLVRAIELDPENPDAHFNLGVMFADADMLREAQKEWERVLEIGADGPARSLAEENLGRIKPLLEGSGEP